MRRLPKRSLIIAAILCITLIGVAWWALSPRERYVIPDEAVTHLEAFASPGKPHADPSNCVACHREEVEAWRRSHHAVANAPLDQADRERLLKAGGDLVTRRGMEYKAVREGLVLHQDGIGSYPVIGKIGITPLIQYLYMASDGRIQAHDVSWDVQREEWFSVFERDDDPEDPRQSGEWGHWTGQGMNWDANCAYCHMTEFAKGYDPGTDRYQLEWTHMAITCAQCHPGMETHLSQIANGNNDWKETYTPQQVMESCAACHARRDELTPHAFRTGDRFEDHFRLTLADVEGIYHPDGQVIGENYVYGSLMMSKMGHAGITCMDCHDPHSYELILPWDNNALCQRCHGSGLKNAPRIDPVAHSRHPAHSTGNQCVECHMPVTFFMARDGRRDHSFSHPDPQLTLEMGIPNACTGCHNTQSVEWSRRYTEEWYGPDMNADRRAKARLMRDLYDGVSGTDTRLLAAIDTEKNRFWKATFLSMVRYLPATPDHFARLEAATKDPDPMIREAAVRLTGLDSLRPETARALRDDPVRSVRLATALASPQLATASAEAEEELRDYLTHTADSPMGALRLSGYWQSRDDPDKAAALARQAIRFEPLNAEVYRLAAVQLHGLGASDEAMELLDEALALDASNPQILFNRGLLHHETGDAASAITDLLRAVEADPAFETAWYNLIVLYWQLNQREAAKAQLVEALSHLPHSQRLRQLAGQLGAP